ncbi:hypothetical protein ACFTZB_23455 [Rhodococcus sp. NPDC057014]|uniref:hypothetical protein n=1 Tax=Rhodococcus sp. NPDC057014 TaxID=3346000 RepID=UPI00363F7AE3
MPNVVAGMIACLGIVIGSLGPWAALPTLTSVGPAGTEGDGLLTLVLAAAGAAALFAILSRGGYTKYGDRWVAPIVGGIVVVIGTADASKISGGEVEVMKTMVTTSIGWGLWVVLLSGAALSVTSFTVSRIVGNRSR